MSNIHLLRAAEKHYAWGSCSAIQGLTGIGSPGRPLAEIWYGDHPFGPTALEDGRTLAELISNEGTNVLGSEVFERFGGRLPFLVKLIAPGQAVSLQVHPRAQRAHEGYAEQLADPAQVQKFVDANHKPEQILALTTFDGLVGLLPIAEADRVLALFDHPLTRAARVTLALGDDNSIRNAISLLAQASTEEVRALVDMAHVFATDGGTPAAETVIELAEQYPDDPGIAVSLMLRRIRLDPGDSVMVDSGVPHAYISGLALEVMANSDNVFRLGLTAKPIDIDESLANLITSSALINRPHRASNNAGPDEFRLEVQDLRSHDFSIAGAGPRVVVALTGRCTVCAPNRSVTLEPGQAVFIPHGTAAVATGSAEVAVVSVPSGGTMRDRG